MIKVHKIQASRYIVVIIIILLLSLFQSGNVYAKEVVGNIEEQKNVLVINSYHQGFSWTKDEMDGIIQTLEQADCYIAVSVEYIDWKQYPNKQNLELFKQNLKFKYEDKKIDLVITTDDVALQFTLTNREELFKDVPVVFCGVNKDSFEHITKGYSNFTGVLEEIDPTLTMQIALEMQPSIDTVYVLFDNLESGLSTGKLVMDQITSMYSNLNVIPLNDLEYNELLDDVKNFDKNSIIILTTYYSDKNGTIIDFKRVSREVSESSSVPVYPIYDISLGSGVLGGNMISGKLQGGRAAKLALSVLEYKNLDEIDITSLKTKRSVIDYNQLERFGLTIDQVPKSCEIINRPFSFFEIYQSFITKVLVIFIVLIVFIVVLLIYLNKINKLKNELIAKNETQVKLYEELTASEEELRQQFDEICEMRQRVAESEESLELAVECADAATWDVNLLDLTYHFTNRYYELLGYEPNEVNFINESFFEILHPDDVLEAKKILAEHFEGKIPCYNVQYRLRKKNGAYEWFNIRGRVKKDCEGTNTRFAGVFVNINAIKENQEKLQANYEELEATYEELTAMQEELSGKYEESLKQREKLTHTEEQLAYLAYYDPLTGLKNRYSLYEKADEEILKSDIKSAAVLFIDLDNFKYINDMLGHSFGDQVLIKVAKQLTSLISDGSYLYRLGGDEFVIIVQNIYEIEEVEVLIMQILSSFKSAIEVLNSTIYVTPSIGVSMYPEHGKTIADLLQFADIAMYHAKMLGRNQYVLYDPLMLENFKERRLMENYMKQSLEKDEFYLQFQPQLELETKRITGFEALLRWNNAELGFVSPTTFIPIAEDTQFIIPLGTWVLQKACAFLRDMKELGYQDLTISVNLSVLQIVQADFYDVVMDAILSYGVNPENIELEITETILMESIDVVGPKLIKLREHGIKIALDDFGKGYSSLNYLSKLPISKLKIDKSFIDNLCTSHESLTRHIIAIGKSLGMDVVAEGVEEEAQLDYLKEYQCDKIQGYLFSKPLSSELALGLLEIYNTIDS